MNVADQVAMGMVDVGFRFNIVASFQYCENYGAHDWDGKGECPQYWKYKGGADEVIASALNPNEVQAFLADEANVDRLVRAFEESNDYATNRCVGVDAVWEKRPTYDEEVDLSLDYGLKFDEATGDLISEQEFWAIEEEKASNKEVVWCDKDAGCPAVHCDDCGHKGC